MRNEQLRQFIGDLETSREEVSELGLELEKLGEEHNASRDGWAVLSTSEQQSGGEVCEAVGGEARAAEARARAEAAARRAAEVECEAESRRRERVEQV